MYPSETPTPLPPKEPKSIVAATAPRTLRIVRRAKPAWLDGVSGCLIRAFACVIRLAPWIIGPLSLTNRHAMPMAAASAHREAVDPRTLMWLGCTPIHPLEVSATGRGAGIRSLG